MLYLLLGAVGIGLYLASRQKAPGCESTYPYDANMATAELATLPADQVVTVQAAANGAMSRRDVEMIAGALFAKNMPNLANRLANVSVCLAEAGYDYDETPETGSERASFGSRKSYGRRRP